MDKRETDFEGMETEKPIVIEDGANTLEIKKFANLVLSNSGKFKNTWAYTINKIREKEEISIKLCISTGIHTEVVYSLDRYPDRHIRLTPFDKGDKGYGITLVVHRGENEDNVEYCKKVYSTEVDEGMCELNI